MSEELPKDLPPDRKIRKAKVKKQTAETIKVAVKNLKDGKVSEVVHIPTTLVDAPAVYKVEAERGRPTKFNKEFAEKYIALIADGYTYSLAAQACSVDQTNVIKYRHMSEEFDATGNPDLVLYANFAKRIKEAEAAYHGKFIKLLEKRADLGDTKAIQFHLERRVAQDYAPKGNVTIDNSQHLHMSDEAVKQLTDAWMKKRTDSTEQIIDTIVTKIDDDVNT